MKNKKILVLVGGSGSGKTAIANKLTGACGFRKVVTTTTRSPRVGERDGIDYHFLSVEEFSKKEKNGGFVESTVYADNMYGTGKDEIDSIIAGDTPAVIVMDSAGARFMKETYKDDVLVAHIRRERYCVVLSILERDIPNEEKAKRIINLDSEDRMVSDSSLYDVSEINRDIDATASHLRSLMVV